MNQTQIALGNTPSTFDVCERKVGSELTIDTQQLLSTDAGILRPLRIQSPTESATEPNSSLFVCAKRGHGFHFSTFGRAFA